MNTVAGVFVEPRMVEQIYFNIENFFKVLPDNNLYFFCGKNTKSIHITNLKKYQYNETNLIIHELDVHDLDKPIILNKTPLGLEEIEILT